MLAEPDEIKALHGGEQLNLELPVVDYEYRSSGLKPVSVSTRVRFRPF